MRVLEEQPSLEKAQAKTQARSQGRGPGRGNRPPKKKPEEMVPIVEDLIRMLDGIGEGYRRGRAPEPKLAAPISKLLRALADELG